MDEKTHYVAMMRRSAELVLRAADEMGDAVLAVVDACETCIRGGGKLIFCGNGGSASDSQHLATEMVIRLRSSVERPSWPALALPMDAGSLTAAGNDYGFDQVFARPLSGLGRPGDVLFGLTTSGKSPNVTEALGLARRMGIVTVGLLGGDGGTARPLCDHLLLVPDRETARVQECHMALGHAVLELLEDRLVGKSGIT